MERRTVVRQGQHLTGSMETFVVATSVDITATGDYEDASQQAWDALVTVIGMRAQPVVLGEPEAVVEMGDYSDTLTGAGFVFEFTTEHAEVFATHDRVDIVDPVAHLHDLLDGIVIGATTLEIGTNIDASVKSKFVDL